MVLETITRGIYWLIIAILIVNLFQKRHMETASKKRMATVFIAALVLLVNIFFALILEFELSSWFVVLALLATAGVGYVLRDRIAIFSLRCKSCGTNLDYQNILFHDDNLCDSCREAQKPPEVEDAPAETRLKSDFGTARDVSHIDWDEWEPTEKAVICYIFHEGKVLLIDKKTGLGSGMVNAPGGRIEAEETAAEAAVRETMEETGIKPTHMRQVGILNFQFTDGYALKGYVFFADGYEGIMGETDEATPFWTSVDAIPYDKMWEDDLLWLPKAIEGSKIEGWFIFQDRTMLSSQVAET
ncbi:MAG: NUDIX domain-containing protein [Spirochaetota bacterium]